MEIEDRILHILNDLCGAEEGELEAGADLFEAGLLDSFGVIQLLIELEEAFDLTLDMAAIPREKIATPRKIAALVREASA